MGMLERAYLECFDIRVYGILGSGNLENGMECWNIECALGVLESLIFGMFECVHIESGNLRLGTCEP